MITQQQILDAFADLDERLLEGASIDDAVAQSALDNGLAPGVLMHRANSQFGDLEAHRGNLRRAAEWRAKDRDEQHALAVHENLIREEASKDVEWCYYACCLDDSSLAGTPSWNILVERLIKRLEITDATLSHIARQAVLEAVERLDRKNGTQTGHLWNSQKV